MQRKLQSLIRTLARMRKQPAQIEALEDRRLLSVVMADGVLTVSATKPNNHVVMSQSRRTITAVLNGESFAFPSRGVVRIEVTGGRRGDVVDLTNVTPPSTINTARGDDVVTGGNGNDTLLGGRGNDTLDGGLGADAINGQRDVDTARYTGRSAGVFVALDEVANDGEAGETDNVMGVENVLGGAGDDSLVGTDGPNSLEGNGGDDVITGEGGGDRLDGGAGNDTLQSADFGTTPDTLVGGDGSDSASSDGADDTSTGDVETSSTQERGRPSMALSQDVFSFEFFEGRFSPAFPPHDFGEFYVYNSGDLRATMEYGWTIDGPVPLSLTGPSSVGALPGQHLVVPARMMFGFDATKLREGEYVDTIHLSAYGNVSPVADRDVTIRIKVHPNTMSGTLEGTVTPPPGFGPAFKVAGKLFLKLTLEDHVKGFVDLAPVTVNGFDFEGGRYELSGDGGEFYASDGVNSITFRGLGSVFGISGPWTLKTFDASLTGSGGWSVGADDVANPDL